MIIEYPLSEGKLLLQEGDVLLYRGTGLISRFIQKISKGKYSHVAVASKDAQGEWESVQLREFKGGIAINLENDIKKNKSVIDVFRPIPKFTIIKFNPETKKVETVYKKFDGNPVTRCMRDLTGFAYGYNRIYFLWRYYTRFWYDWSTITTDDTAKEIVFPVCSTAVAHCFTKNGYDLLKNRSDEYMSPSDLALSARLNYLFTLTVEEDLK